MLQSLSAEQMADFLAHERYRLAAPVFEASGFGITEEACFIILLKWLKQEIEV
jgi:hypothetical protein